MYGLASKATSQMGIRRSALNSLKMAGASPFSLPQRHIITSNKKVQGAKLTSFSIRNFSLPDHQKVALPNLSPTMESGGI
jgi:hypothetical protein